jgi:hypothetical protein
MKKSLAGRAFLLLLGLPFAGVALGVLCLSLIPGIYEWQQMKSWQPVQAQLLSAQLVRNQHTSEVVASYHYRYQMEDHTSDRVGIFGGADNIGDFHTTLGYQLERALASKQPVSAWVNPEHPEEAVLNRDMRWDLVGFKLIFVLVFGLIGAGIILLAFNTSFGSTGHPESASKPWLSQKEWASPQIRCNGNYVLSMIWFLAFFVNLISLPLLLDFSKEWNSGNKLILIAMIFPLCGFALLIWAIKYTLSWRRFGQLVFNLDPYPGSIGGQVGGYIDVPVGFNPQQRFSVTLQCVRRYTSGTGKQRSQREDVMWSSNGVARTQMSVSGGTLLRICFNVPRHLPQSEVPSNDYRCWRLTLSADLPGVALERHFVLPVFATAQQSSAALPLSTDHAQAIEQYQQQFERVVNLEQIPGGVRMVFPMLHNWGNNLVGLISGAFFAGAGLLMNTRADAPGLLVWSFTGVGTLITLLALRALFRHLHVEIDQQGITSRHYWLGIPTGRKQMAREQVRTIGSQRAVGLQSNRQPTNVCNLYAYSIRGDKVLVAMNLQDGETAQLALDTIATLTGYPVRAASVGVKEQKHR